MTVDVTDLPGTGPQPGPRQGPTMSARLWALCGALVLAAGLGLWLWPRLARAVPGGPRLSVTGAYMRVPASPDVAAVYLTIRNDGGTADTLVSVSTPDAASAQLHAEVGRGGTESMRALSELPVPAHGQAALSAGADHLMLLDPHPVRAGDQVSVVLRFASSGPLTVRVPVIGLFDPVPGG